MGIAAEWINVKGLPREEVLRRLALEETEETFSLETEWPIFRQVDAFVVTLKSGRIVVASRNVEVSDAALAKRVSIGAEVVTGSMEEHVMYSEACGYVDGRRIWRILHDPDRDPFAKPHGVEIDGSMPPEFAQAIKQGATEFELPVEVSNLVGDYRPDNALLDTNDIVTIVVTDETARKATRKAAREQSGGLFGAVRRMFGGS